MARYRFIIRGRGQFSNDCIGFFTTRWCNAPSRAQAEELALESVRKDWAFGSKYQIETLHIEYGWPIGIFDILRAPNKGCTFYGEENEEEARAVEFEAARAPVSV